MHVTHVPLPMSLSRRALESRAWLKRWRSDRMDCWETRERDYGGAKSVGGG